MTKFLFDAMKSEKYMELAKEKELKEAFRIVENHCRQLGKDCQIIFLSHCVSIAPTSWSGDSTGKTFYEAFCDARRVE